MTHQADRKSDDIQLIIAYLDGELPRPEAELVERRLATDADFCALLQQHQQTWDLLDELPKTEVGEQFVRSTVEMVSITTGDLIKRTNQVESRSARLWWIGLGASTLAAVLVGFLFARTVAWTRDRQLVRDLPVIEYLDAYRHAESIEFLQLLAAEGVFVEEADDAL